MAEEKDMEAAAAAAAMATDAGLERIAMSKDGDIIDEKGGKGKGGITPGLPATVPGAVRMDPNMATAPNIKHGMLPPPRHVSNVAVATKTDIARETSLMANASGGKDGMQLGLARAASSGLVIGNDGPGFGRAESQQSVVDRYCDGNDDKDKLMKLKLAKGSSQLSVVERYCKDGNGQIVINENANLTDLEVGMLTLQRGNNLVPRPGRPGAYPQTGSLSAHHGDNVLGLGGDELREQSGDLSVSNDGPSHQPESSQQDPSLPKALPVQDDPEGNFRTSATKVDENDMERQEKQKALNRRKTTAHIIGGVLLLLIVVITAIVAVTVGDKKSEDDTKPTLAPTVELTLSTEEHILSLLPEATREAITVASPQASSYTWLLDDPNVTSYSDQRLVQRFALATFYFSTGGQLTNSTWLFDDLWLDYSAHECDWFAAAEHGFLAFGSWSESLYNHTSEKDRHICGDNELLEHLWLRSNGLNGPIPDELFLLTSLKSISIDGNALVGTLPTAIGQLTNLEALGVFANKLTGQIPTELGKATSLRHLWLLNNDAMISTIPSELGLLSNTLEWMDLDYIPLLYGTVPSELGRLSKLEWFSLWVSRVSGQLPSEIGNWEPIKTIAIDITHISGTIPTEIGRLTNMEKIHIGDMILTGPIPSELGLCTSLTSLGYSRNLFTGTLPTEMGHLTNMEILQGSGTQMTGRIPTELGQWQEMAWAWDFSHNSFTGQIPSELGLPSSLKHLRLNGNQLTGNIPSELGLLKDLENLWLDHNALSGVLPSELGELDTPATVWNGTTMVPTSYVSELFLDNNNLTGSVPSWLERLPGLSSLTLNNNTGLAGTIPTGLCNLTTWDTPRPYEWWESETWYYVYTPRTGQLIVRSYSPFLGISVDCESVECTCSVCACDGAEVLEETPIG